MYVWTWNVRSYSSRVTCTAESLTTKTVWSLHARIVYNRERRLCYRDRRKSVDNGQFVGTFIDKYVRACMRNTRTKKHRTYVRFRSDVVDVSDVSSFAGALSNRSDSSCPVKMSISGATTRHTYVILYSPGENGIPSENETANVVKTYLLLTATINIRSLRRGVTITRSRRWLSDVNNKIILEASIYIYVCIKGQRASSSDPAGRRISSRFPSILRPPRRRRHCIIRCIFSLLVFGLVLSLRSITYIYTYVVRPFRF